jgi:hypothetical protein
MVLMALVTTFMTSPVLARIYPVRLLAMAGRHAEAESTRGDGRG